jgi:peroxiredoxin
VILAVQPTFALEPTPGSKEIQQAREILEASAKAYREVVALRDVMTYVVEIPGSELMEKTLRYSLGAGSDASVEDPVLQAYALGDRMILARSDVDDKYVEVPFDGDFGATLNRLVGQEGSLPEVAPIAMRANKGLDAYIHAMGFKILRDLEISGYSLIEVEPGQSLHEIALTATGGRVSARIDPETLLLVNMELEARPAGAPEGVVIRARGRFDPEILDSADGVVAFDTSGRHAVDDLSALGSGQVALGTEAPDFALETLEGDVVRLTDLQGSVVLIDFWATWCAPCWKTLKLTQELADWAERSDLPVRVFGMNVLETFPTASEKVQKVGDFWSSQKLTMPTLLDLDDSVYAAFGSPGLPSMILIGPDGTILQHHAGFVADMVETLQQEVKNALAAEKNALAAE